MRPWQRQSLSVRRRGFTLVEVLLVLAVLVLFTTLLLPGVNSIFRAMEARAPQEVLGATVLAARAAALETGRTVGLRYEADRRRFTSDHVGLGPVSLSAGVALDLLPAATGGYVLLGGQLTETGGLDRIRFFPDGTCDPFRVRLREGEAPPRMLTVDPWTCALSPLPVEDR